MSDVFSPLDMIETCAVAARAEYATASGGFSITDIGSIALASSMTGAATVSQTVGTSYGCGIDEETFLYDFYNHIWIIPTKISLLNPQIGQAQGFQIWNATLDYSGNTLSSITATGASTLSLSFSAPLDFGRLELKSVSVTINNATILNIDAKFTFDFTVGYGDFEFIASLVSLLAIPAEAPISETWNWNTDIKVGIDNTEHRASLRLVPSRQMKQTCIALQSSDVRQQIFQSLYDWNGYTLIPFWQYSATLSQANSTGDTTLTFNPAYTDIRVGEYVMLSSPDFSQQQLATIATITDSGCTLTTGLQIPLPANSLICPALTCVIADKFTLSRYAVNAVAKADLNVKTALGRSSLSRPNTAATINTFDNMTVLDFARPTLDGDTIDQTFQTGVDSQDYKIGRITNINTWNFTQTIYNLNFLIHRQSNPVEMDYWRDFGAAIIGSLKPFLMPTWRDDLLIISDVPDAANQFTVSGSDYYYEWNASPNRRLMLQTTAGITYVIVSTVALDDAGDTVVTLSTGLPSGYNVIDTVSFLQSVRLEGDEFKLKHMPLETILTLVVRTVLA